MNCDNCKEKIPLWQTGYSISEMTVCHDCYRNYYEELKYGGKEKRKKRIDSPKSASISEEQTNEKLFSTKDRITFQSSKYPIIKIPNGLVNPQLGEEPTEPKKPTEPSEPKESGIFVSLLVFLVAFFVMVFLSTSTDGSMVGFILGIIVFFAIVIGFQRSNDKSKEQYHERRKKYNEDLAEYNKKYSQYIQERKDHKLLQMQLSNDPDFKNKFFIQKQFEYLESALKPDVNTETITEGVAEPYFHDYLEDFFGSKIYSNLILPNRSGGRHYYPDFVYWDKDKNLLIDIEIDEPYIGQDGIPIHYSVNDKDRNKTFIRNRWIVIRFAEKQIINHPKKCCQVIKKVIVNIFGEDQIKDLNTEFLPKENKWSRREAKRMAADNYRNNYLPKDLQFQINKENLVSDDYNVGQNEIDDDLPF